LYTA